MAEVKVTKKDIKEAKQPDAVLVGATSLFDWILANRNLVIGAIVALLVVVGAALLISESSASKRAEVGGQLGRAVALASRPVVPGVAIDTDTFPTAEAKRQAEQKAFAEIVSEHPGSEAAHSAQLQLARVSFEEGRYDDAIAGFQKSLDALGNSPLRLFALEGLGYAYEAKGDLAKAKETFQRLSNAGAPARSLYQQARIAELSGQKDEARKLYEQVTKDYENEVLAGEAQARLELLGLPPAGQGALEAPAPAPVPEQPARQRTGQR